MSLLTETLERRLDAAFGVTHAETERNDLLTQRVQELDQDIREAFWVEDEASRSERDYFERLLKENGMDAWRIPGGEEEPALLRSATIGIFRFGNFLPANALSNTSAYKI